MSIVALIDGRRCGYSQDDGFYVNRWALPS
jgi:hypothetical protein